MTAAPEQEKSRRAQRKAGQVKIELVVSVNCIKLGRRVIDELFWRSSKENRA